MFESVEDVKRYCEEQGVKIIDFKMIDLAGRWHHLSITIDKFDERVLEDGIGFDGSSYGFLSVEKSDMIFKPDLSTAFIDPFTHVKTLVMLATIYTVDGKTKRFESDPLYVAQKAEKYMKDTGFADECLFGPEFEFYIFDSTQYSTNPNDFGVKICSNQSHWESNCEGEHGFKVGHHGGYHVDAPLDTSYDLRNEMVLQLEKLNVPIKYHHHEVGGPGQVEIELSFGSCLEMAHRSMLVKYIVKNMAINNGKTATFMPKPIFKEAGNGMHVHFQMFKDEKPLFYDKKGYSDLSKEALYAIGGMLKHAPALLAFTNPSTNSYKRLVPGYEAPVSVCFGTANRSAVIRVPGYAKQPDKKRFEFRSSDATCNPYLAYSALLMAALDGIENRIDPSKEGFGPYDVNVFNLPEDERKKIKALPTSLSEAADALENDYDFLLKGNVFTKGIIQDQIDKIRKDELEMNIIPTAHEFAKYFDL